MPPSLPPECASRFRQVRDVKRGSKGGGGREGKSGDATPAVRQASPGGLGLWAALACCVLALGAQGHLPGPDSVSLAPLAMAWTQGVTAAEALSRCRPVRRPAVAVVAAAQHRYPFHVGHHPT